MSEKTPLRLIQNGLAFEVKRKAVSDKMYLCLV